jgi:peptide-methionine (S)-S-oxide reductase
MRISEAALALTRRHAGNLLLAAVAGAIVFTAAARLPSFAAEPAVKLPAPAVDVAEKDGLQTVVLAGGCFWGVQGVFQHTDGVTRAISGYSGGTKQTAEYETVSSGTTGHAESVKVTFDPKKISYGKILQIFFSVAHDPTQLNRQGPDYGTQYRSAIFYAGAEQKRVTDAYIKQLNAAKVFKHPIVTQVNALQAFYPAESYHQDYATLHPNNPYIAYNDLPKIESLRAMMPDVYRTKPVLVAGNVTN